MVLLQQTMPVGRYSRRCQILKASWVWSNWEELLCRYESICDFHAAEPIDRNFHLTTGESNSNLQIVQGKALGT